VAPQPVRPAGPQPGDVPELSAHLDSLTGRVEQVGRLDRATAHLLHETVAALLATTRAQWTIDVTGATVGDHHGLRALAAAYRRAGRYHPLLILPGPFPPSGVPRCGSAAASAQSLAARSARTEGGRGDSWRRDAAWVHVPPRARPAVPRCE